MPVVLGLLWHSLTVTQLARSVRSPPLFGPPSGCTVGPETEQSAPPSYHSSLHRFPVALPTNRLPVRPALRSLALRVM